jgi:hypothetical protein
MAGECRKPEKITKTKNNIDNMKNMNDFATDVREVQVLRDLAASFDNSAREILTKLEGRTAKLAAALGLADLSSVERKQWDDYLKAIPNVFDRQYLVHVLSDHAVGLRAYLKAWQMRKDAPFMDILEQAMALQAAAKLEADGPGSASRFYFN